MSTAQRVAQQEIDDEDDADAAFEAGLEIGGHNADIAEARRMLSIFNSHAAMAKPYAAWSLLPLGFCPRGTIQRLAEYPVEPDPNDAYQYFLNLLNARFERARATAEMENPDVRKH